MPDNCWVARAFQQGERAGYRGNASNPYPFRSELRKAWEKGWTAGCERAVQERLTGSEGRAAPCMGRA
jgi:ribosome modulation factor